jgi:hypothetical protein
VLQPHDALFGALFGALALIVRRSPPRMAAAAALIAEESNLEDGMDLLGEEPVDGDIFDIHDRSSVTSPIVTGDVLATLGRDVFPQTALYGRVISQHGDDLPRKPQDVRLFINSNAPSSGLVCGVQVRIPYSLHEIFGDSLRPEGQR